MPHQCTNCGHTFPDGSKEMLSGCPDCGGNKFQFQPDAAPDEPSDADPPDPPEPEGGGVTSAVGKAAASVRDTLSSGSDRSDGADAGDWPDPDGDESTPSTEDSVAADRDEPAARDGAAADDREFVDDDRREFADDDREDSAQADARSEMVSSDDLPPKPDREGTVVQEPESDDRPDMNELREELNSQFESIKVVAPGQYELNLMELYDREEYIIALQENGRYVIEVPDSWRDEDA